MSAPQPPQQGMPPVPSVRQNISEGLMNFGFQQLGSAFAQEFQDPSLAAPIANIGNNISNTLRQRWFKKEFEDFQEMHGKQYQSDSMGLFDNMTDQFESLTRGEIPNADGTVTKITVGSEQYIRMKNSILRNTVSKLGKMDDDFFQSAGKYASNPFVNNTVQRLVQSRSQMINELTGPTAVQENEMSIAKIVGLGADKKLAESKARYYDRMPNNGSNKDKDIYATNRKLYNDLGGTPQAWISNHLTNPELKGRLEEYMDAAKGQRTKELISENPSLEYFPEKLSADLAADNELILKKAAMMMTKASGLPGVYDVLAEHPDFEAAAKQNLPEPEPPVHNKLLTPKEHKSFIRKKVKPDALRILDEVMSQENPPTLSKLLEMWEKSFTSQYTPLYAKNAGAQDELAKVKEEAISYIKDNWNKNELARIRFGTKTGPENRLLEKRKGPFSRLLDLDVKEKPSISTAVSRIGKAVEFLDDKNLGQ